MRPGNRQHGSRMAIDELLDEHEQGERVRAWLRQNALGIFGGIALGLGLIYGWQWWQQQREGERAEAATRYQAAVDQLKAGKIAEARPRIAALPEGIYDTLGALALAKAQLDDGKRDEAIATLRGVQADDPALAGVVRDRLASLLIDAGKAQDAIALLAGAGDDARVLALRGDAYTALGQSDKARDAYARALVQIEVGDPARRLVELKLAEVGGAPAGTKDSQEARG
jgi:predicted negative regulator of RcsB-dependent stress response